MEGTVTMPLSEYHRLLEASKNAENKLEERTIELEKILFELTMKLFEIEKDILTIGNKSTENYSIVRLKNGEDIKLYSFINNKFAFRIKLKTI